jgi:acetyl esterase
MKRYTSQCAMAHHYAPSCGHLWRATRTTNYLLLLYFHGGGFTVGSPETHEGVCKQLAHLAQCAVVSLDYRLAPEHKFPTAHRDAIDALKWLAEHAQTLGLDAQRIAIGGDSAGGTLTATAPPLARGTQVLPCACN